MFRIVSLVLLVLACLAPDFAVAAKKKATPAPPKPIYEAPMRVVIVRSTLKTCEPLCPEWIAAEGEITPATPQAFRNVFKQMGKKKLPIIIRSPGGSITHALEIGRMIRKRGLDVAVGATTFTGCAPDNKSCKLPKEDKGIYRGSAGSWFGFCNSACPLVVAGGIKRLIGNDVQIGVHKPKTIWTNERVWYRETYRIVNGKKKVISRKISRREKLKPKVTYGYDKRLRKQLTTYFKEMGIDPAIIAESEETAYKDIKNLTAGELDTYRLRTSTSSPRSLSNPALCEDKTAPTVCVAEEMKMALAVPKPPEKFQIPQGGRPMSFHLVRNRRGNCEPNCPEWIVADGFITEDTPLAFKSFLRTLGKNQRPIMLNSEGGSIRAALQIAEQIKSAGVLVGEAITEFHSCDPRTNSCKNVKKGQPHFGFIWPSYPSSCRDACTLLMISASQRIFDEIQLVNPALLNRQSTTDFVDQLRSEVARTGKGVDAFESAALKYTGFLARANAAVQGILSLPGSTDRVDSVAFCVSGPAVCIKR